MQLKCNNNLTKQCITSKYIENVSGNRTYTSTTKYRKKIILTGDSQFESIKRNLLSDFFYHVIYFNTSMCNVPKWSETL